MRTTARLAVVLTGAALATAALTALPADRQGTGLPGIESSQSSCPQRSVNQSEMMRYATTESRDLYVRKWHRIYYNDCGRRGDTITGIQAGVAPWGRETWCKTSVYDKTRINPGAIAGQNPGAKTIECRPKGNSVYFNLRDTRYWPGAGDRSLVTGFTQVRGWGVPDVRRSPVGPLWVP